MQVDSLKQVIVKNKEKALKDYLAFLSFPSVSSEPAYHSQVRACALWVKDRVEKMGFHTELWETKGHPVIFASYDKAGPGQPTLLIYNHYDVQPADPLELWESPPFEPRIQNGEVYARGAQDNKGQCFYVLQALQTLLERDGTLPINIKLCIEGEEEMGSASLEAILPSKKKQLHADYLAIVDLGIPDAHSPAITLGTRGLVALEIELEGASLDLHSGSHGGIVFNPLHALVELLSRLRDPVTGEILVPGFYEGVQPMSETEKKRLSFAFDLKNYQKQFGAEATGGETKLPPLERNWLRPTIEINGLWGGYIGDGMKTVIPAKAHAKLTCRLVPNQDPAQIAKKVLKFLEQKVAKGVKITSQVIPGGGLAVRTSPDSKLTQAFAKAYEEVFQKPCQYILSGASIPVVPQLKEACGGDVILLGLGLDTDKIHSPNEHFGLDRIEKGILIMGLAMEALRS